MFTNMKYEALYDNAVQCYVFVTSCFSLALVCNCGYSALHYIVPLVMLGALVFAAEKRTRE